MNPPRALFLSGVALRRYFYMLDEEGSQRPTLYDVLRSAESASLADLRLAWRLRSIELGSIPRGFGSGSKPNERSTFSLIRTSGTATTGCAGTKTRLRCFLMAASAQSSSKAGLPRMAMLSLENESSPTSPK